MLNWLSMAKKRINVTPEMIEAVMKEMGRRGGKAGGEKSSANMTPEQRTERARRAAQARWGKPGKGGRKKA
jgi:hypothetical protein